MRLLSMNFQPSGIRRIGNSCGLVTHHCRFVSTRLVLGLLHRVWEFLYMRTSHPEFIVAMLMLILAGPKAEPVRTDSAGPVCGLKEYSDEEK